MEVKNKKNSLEDINQSINSISGDLKQIVNLCVNRNIENDNEKAEIQRALFGEQKTGLTGLVADYKEVKDDLQNFRKDVNERFDVIENSLQNISSDLKTRDIKRDTTFKNINLLYYILTSAGACAFYSFIAKFIK